MGRWGLRIWGSRGSFPAPGPATVRYGGKTPCVALEGPGPTLVLDAGTGIRLCGAALDARGEREVELLVTHVHWDHIQGLPFFAPLHRAGGRVRVRGPAPAGSSLREVVTGLLAPDVFPVALEASLEVESLPSGAVEAAGWSVRSLRMCHPGPTFGYRMDREGVAPVAYLPDNELAGDRHGVGPGWRAGLVDFLRGVHTLVHDATNAEEEAAPRHGWGHSSPAEAVALAAEAGCRRLVLFHHDPGRDDRAIDALLRQARDRAGAVAPGLTVEAAAEGAVLTLELEG